ncbi:hypothetical protein GCG21_08025 [Pseudactinotalea sp. HY160]|uniref:hypothetical protein n=1 Tax=Pseudactinotalea sp. HY160 TaxID=2654490 RepID=UPI00128E3509|nr:hypothetical protein [Pseudactinotalea sp. HY160]MPV49952.1 hypothetical protein [Pseudactinotalea sp. HY160]
MDRHRWTPILACVLFGTLFGVLLAVIMLGRLPLVSDAGVIMLLAGGFAIAGVALLPPLARRRGAGGGPNASQWPFLALGVAAWCAAPVLQLVWADGDLMSQVGSGGRAIPTWPLILLTWGTAALMLVAGLRQHGRARREGAGHGR